MIRDIFTIGSHWVAVTRRLVREKKKKNDELRTANECTNRRHDVPRSNEHFREPQMA